MRRIDAQKLLWERGRMLREGLTEVIARRRIPAQCAGYEPMMSMAFEGEDAGLRKAMMSVYQQEMLRRGFLAGAGHPLSVAHTEEVIEAFVGTADEAFAEIRAGLDAGDLPSRLETTGERQEGFRRLV
jgi:glutamate-1-semialdehyde aminotransferase